MEAVVAAIVAVDVLAAFVVLLLLALAGLRVGEAVKWLGNEFVHPVEMLRKIKRGDGL
jgi:hypothetical protein